MAFKQVSDLSTNNAIALGGTNRKTNKANPTTITGYFLGSKEVESPKSKTGKAKLHVFQTEEGSVGVWGKTDLDSKMQNVPAGALTRVTFTGMQETKNNPMYKYKVEVDSDNTIDVAPTETSSYESTDDEPYSVASYEDDVDQEPTPAPITAPRNPAQTPSPAQKARVDAILNRRK